ncbi:MAG: hypothetical protein HY074_09320, partial [Deltaproteobacteria bacterium]|nr:hypothetical protein [Deltaproteobacteria bacterium]
VQALDLILFRALAVPLILISILKKLRAEREFDTVPANFVIWTMALAVLIASYWFGQKTFPSDLQSSIHIGTAAAGVLTGIFILANQSSTVGQLIGLLTMESGIVLTEVFAAGREQWFIQLGISLVFVWTVGLIWEFLHHFSELEVHEAEAADGPRIEERDVL